MVYWTAYGVVKNESDALDVSQNTFIKVLANMDKLSDMGEKQIKSWLYRVAVNLCVDGKRKLKREIISEEVPEQAVSDYELPENTVVTEDTRRIVREAIETLPEIYKQTVYLHYFSGMQYDEIAQVLGVSEGTVKSRMSRAKDKLYSILKEGEHYR